MFVTRCSVVDWGSIWSRCVVHGRGVCRGSVQQGRVVSYGGVVDWSVVYRGVVYRGVVQGCVVDRGVMQGGVVAVVSSPVSLNPIEAKSNGID